MYYLTKEFVFDSAHQLLNKNIYGKCSQLHGHTYHLFVTVSSNELKNGMVINFNDLKKIVEKNIIEKLDHQFLNDVSFLKNEVTTCECMTHSIYNIIENELKKSPKTKHVSLFEIKLYETPTSYCTYGRSQYYV